MCANMAGNLTGTGTGIVLGLLHFLIMFSILDCIPRDLQAIFVAVGLPLAVEHEHQFTFLGATQV